MLLKSILNNLKKLDASNRKAKDVERLFINGNIYTAKKKAEKLSKQNPEALIMHAPRFTAKYGSYYIWI